jgi:hypothetical protein
MGEDQIFDVFSISEGPGELLKYIEQSFTTLFLDPSMYCQVDLLKDLEFRCSQL